jgi:hypothetical protein
LARWQDTLTYAQSEKIKGKLRVGKKRHSEIRDRNTHILVFGDSLTLLEIMDCCSAGGNILLEKLLRG